MPLPKFSDLPEGATVVDQQFSDLPEGATVEDQQQFGDLPEGATVLNQFSDLPPGAFVVEPDTAEQERTSTAPVLPRAVARGAVETAATQLRGPELSRSISQGMIRDFQQRIKGDLNDEEFDRLIKDIVSEDGIPFSVRAEFINIARDVRAGKIKAEDIEDKSPKGNIAKRLRLVAEAMANVKFPLTKEEEKKLPVKVARGVGSTAVFLGARLLPGGQILLPATAAGIGAGEAIERAARNGANDEQKARAALLGVFPGLTDIVPIERLLRPIAKSSGAKGALYAIARKAWEQGLIEGGQESLQAFMQNAIEQLTTKPGKSLTEGIQEDGLVGFLVGTLFGSAAGISAPTTEAPPPGPADEIQEPPAPPPVEPTITDEPVPTEVAGEPTIEAVPGEIPAETPAPAPVAPVSEAVETPSVEEAPQKRQKAIEAAPKGKTQKVSTPGGTEVETEFALVEVADLIASNLDSGAINPAFPQSLQPRDRTRPQSQAQIAQLANKLPADKLTQGTDVQRGAPIIGPDAVVESGNGRVLAIGRAYRTDKAEDYRQFLKDNAERFGLEAENVDVLSQPVLVRVRKTALDEAQRVEFGRQANVGTVAALSATEEAGADAKRLTDDDLAVFAPSEDGNILAASNDQFVRRFLSKLSQREQGTLLTAEGRPSRQLVERIRAAIFAKAYKDDRLIALQAEEADPDIKTILNALTRAAPAFARARSVEADLSDLNVIEPLTEAIEIVGRAKRSGQGVDGLLSQGGLFEQPSQNAATLAKFLDLNKRSAKRMGFALKTLGEVIERELSGRKQGRLIGDPVGLPEVLRTTNELIKNEFGDSVVIGDLFDQPSTESLARTSAPAGGALTKAAKSVPPTTQAPPSQVSTVTRPSRSTARETPPSTIEGVTTTLALGATDKASNRIILQKSKDPKKLINTAKSKLPGLKKRLINILDEVPGTRFVQIRVKNQDRALEKVSLGRPAETISDYLGVRLAVNDTTSLSILLERLNTEFNVLEVENFLGTPKNGYRAVHVQAAIDNNFSVEIQLVPEPIAQVQEEAHLIYDELRNIIEIDSDTFQTLDTRSVAIFDRAWEKWLSGTVIGKSSDRTPTRRLEGTREGIDRALTPLAAAVQEFQETAKTTKLPRLALKDLTIEIPVEIEDTKETTTIEANAARALKDAQQRVTRFRALRDCINAS